MAAKENTSESEIDLASHAWVKACGACHPGGGPMEFDRDGRRYDERAQNPDWDPLDGDYHGSDWANTGVVEADCLLCHMESYRTSRRTPILKAGMYRAAPVEGAGMATARDNAIMEYDPTFRMDIVPPADRNCSQCHGGVPEELFNAAGVLKSDIAKRGRSWDDPMNIDVHDESLECIDCHTAGEGDVGGETVTRMEHQFQKGNVMTGSGIRNDLDFELGMESCESCHTNGTHGAPAIPTSQNHTIHTGVIHCSTCHIPNKDLFAVNAFDFLEGTKVPFFIGGNPNDPYKAGIQPTYMWWHEESEPPYQWKIYPYNLLTAFVWTKGKTLRDAYHLKQVKAVYDSLPDGTLANDVPDKFSLPEPNTTAEIQAFTDAMKAAYPNDDPTIWIAPEAFQLSHNVKESTNALGAGGCTDCHTPNSPFFSRLVQVYAWDIEDPDNDPNVKMEIHIHDKDGNSSTIEEVRRFIPMWEFLGYTEARKDALEVER